MVNYELEIPGYGCYQSIESSISVRARRKYCDFTGYERLYTHKQTKLRYLNWHQCKEIDKMAKSKIDELLANRNATVVLK